MKSSLILLAFLTSFAAVPASAETLVGVSDENSLVRIDTANPGVALSDVPITGLQAGESIVSIDFSPHTGQLVGLGDNNRLYLLDSITGAASLLGNKALKPSIDDNTVSLEVDPVIGDIRILDGTGLNLVIDAISGLLNSLLGTLLYGLGDENAGAVPNIISAAFDNLNLDGDSILYLVDGATGSLVQVVDGLLVDVLNTVTEIQGINVTDIVGFDIGATGVAILSTLLDGGEGSQLFILNLVDGTTTLIGDTLENLLDITIVPPLPENGDTDGDGVINEQDRCPNTPSESIVNNNGCTLAQQCPCEGPRTGGTYKKNGYQKCMRQHSKIFKKEGVITKQERKLLMQEAKAAPCGQP